MARFTRTQQAFHLLDEMLHDLDCLFMDYHSYNDTLTIKFDEREQRDFFFPSVRVALQAYGLEVHRWGDLEIDLYDPEAARKRREARRRKA